MLNVKVGLKLDKIDSIKSSINNTLTKLGNDATLKVSKVKLDNIVENRTTIQSSLDQISSKGSGLTIQVANVKLSNDAINSLTKQLDKLGVKLKVDVDPTNMKKGVEQVVENVQKAKQQADTITFEQSQQALAQLNARLKEVREGYDSFAKASETFDRNGNLTQAIIKYKNAMGQSISELHKWVTVNQEGDQEFQKVAETYTNNAEKMRQVESAIVSLKEKAESLLTSFSNNGKIDTSVVENLRKELNSIDLTKGKEQITEFVAKLETIKGNEGNVAQLQKALNELVNARNKLYDNGNLTLFNLNGDTEKLYQVEKVIADVEGKIKDLQSGNVTLVGNEFKLLKEQVTNATKEVTNLSTSMDKVANDSEKINSLKSAMQGLIDSFRNSGKFNDTFVDHLQNKLNNLSADASVKEVEKLHKEFTSLVKSENQIDVLQRKLDELVTARDKVNNNKGIKFIEDDQKAKLEEVDKLIATVKNTLNDLKTDSVKLVGNDFNNLKTQCTDVTKSLKDIDSSLTKIADNSSKVASLKSQMEQMLTSFQNTGKLSQESITQLGEALNKITAKTPIEEAQKLLQSFKQFKTAESQILTLENKLNSLKSTIEKVDANKKVTIFDPAQTKAVDEANASINTLQSTITKLSSGTIMSANEVRNLSNEAVNCGNNLKNAFQGGSTAVSSFGNTLRTVATYMLGGTGIMAGINTIRNAFQEIVDIDNSLRDLKRITQDTDSSLSNYVENYDRIIEASNQNAISLAKTTTEVMDATTAWIKLGESVDNATGYLSDASIILGNVADMSTEDATQALVSIKKAFQVESEDIMTVVDIVNEAGNKFALSSSDLAEGLRVGASTLAIAGNDVVESASLVTTATEILQDASAVGVGLEF